jgi:hypothetical protein
MSSSPTPIIQGYLVLADISGYTSFISQTELDHADEILSDLLETVLQRFKPLLTIHKIEGDAIFAYAAGSRLMRGETLLELVETTYVDFRERMKNVRRHTTCTCRACQSIPMLDLKFIVHHGSFVLQHIGGAPELAGSDVNLVHRLLKNHVAENTGWRAYALFTSAALDSMRLHPEGLVEGHESYEHLGDVQTHVMDMHARYEALMQQRRIVVEDKDALVSFIEDMPATPPILWGWMNEPEKRRLYSLDPHALQFIAVLRPGGRTTQGATTHCIHGKAVAMRETVLDWKPFDYYTVEQDSGPMGLIRVTFRLQPLDSGRRTRLHVLLDGGFRHVPALLARPLIKLIYMRVFNYRVVALKLRETLESIGDEGSTNALQPASAEPSLAPLQQE